MKNNRYAIFGVLFVAFVAIAVSMQLFPRDQGNTQTAKHEKVPDATVPQAKTDHDTVVPQNSESAAKHGHAEEETIVQDPPEQSPAKKIATEPAGSWSSEDPHGEPRPDTFADPEIGAQLRTVQVYLTDYQSVFHENPVGTNAEIVRALLGANPEKEVFLEPLAKF